MPEITITADPATYRELVETLAHGAMDRVRMGHPPSAELDRLVGDLMRTDDDSELASGRRRGDSGVMRLDAAEAAGDLTRDEAADLAGRSVPTIDRWRADGLRWHRRANRVYIRQADLEEYLNGA